MSLYIRVNVSVDVFARVASVKTSGSEIARYESLTEAYAAAQRIKVPSDSADTGLGVAGGFGAGAFGTAELQEPTLGVADAR